MKFLRDFIFILLLILLFKFSLTKQYLLGPTLARKTVYIDSDFDENELQLIRNSANDWEQETHGLVKFNLIYNFDVNESYILKNENNSFVLIRSHIDDLEIEKLDLIIKNTALGLYSTENKVHMVRVVPGRMESYPYYQGVITHELGHAIGLEHLSKELTVMYPSMDLSSYYLTKSDIKWFCRTYYCDASELGGN